MNIRAKKRFGQNFLTDKTIKDKIIQSMPNDTATMQVVEIGPGLGDLTKELLRKHTVVAYEIDSVLCRHLRDVFREDIKSKRFTLYECDVLETWDCKKSLFETDYCLVANIPYYITAPIIEQSLKDNNCKTIIIMVQREFAKKLVAKEKSSDSTFISNLTQIIGSVKILFDVPPTSFEPQPKVFSSVVCIEKNEASEKINFIELKRYLKKAFSNPRRILQKNLYGDFNKDVVTHAFLELNIDKNLRPHELSSDNHFHLFKKIYQIK